MGRPCLPENWKLELAWADWVTGALLQRGSRAVPGMSRLSSKRLASFATFLKILDYFRNTHYLTLIETLVF